MNVVAVVGHPDDEILGCGGTLARLAHEGHAVSIVILGEGARSRLGGDEGEGFVQVMELTACAANAAAILGVRLAARLTWPDNRFDTVPLLDIVQSLEASLADLQPEVIFTHNPYCLNVDHRITCQAVLTATRPGTSSVRAVYGFETPSATERAFGALGTFTPNLYYDITGHWSQKIRAMECYASECRTWPHARSEGKLKARASMHGGTIATDYAEAFMVLREVR